MSTLTISTPERSLTQRYEALIKANAIRSERPMAAPTGRQDW